MVYIKLGLNSNPVAQVSLEENVPAGISGKLCAAEQSGTERLVIRAAPVDNRCVRLNIAFEMSSLACPGQRSPRTSCCVFGEGALDLLTDNDF